MSNSTNYEQALNTIKEYTNKTENDVLWDFLADNADEKKYHWEEWAIRAIESEEFEDYVVSYAYDVEMDNGLQEYYNEINS